MILYLSCLEAFARFIRETAAQEKKSPLSVYNTVDLERGTVAGFSIRYSGMTGSPEVWNKALKCLLVNLKVLLAWVTGDVGVVDAGSSAVPPQLALGEGPRNPRGLGNVLSQSMRASMFSTRN
jgi:hypothetical protein